jgi:hypothetical protein
MPGGEESVEFCAAFYSNGEITCEENVSLSGIGEMFFPRCMHKHKEELWKCLTLVRLISADRKHIKSVLSSQRIAVSEFTRYRIV